MSARRNEKPCQHTRLLSSPFTLLPDNTPAAVEGAMGSTGRKSNATTCRQVQPAEVHNQRSVAVLADPRHTIAHTASVSTRTTLPEATTRTQWSKSSG